MTIQGTSGINPVITPPKVNPTVKPPETKPPTTATTETQTQPTKTDTDETKKPAPTTGVDKPLPVAFTPISPEARKMLNELMADPKISSMVSPADLMAMCKEYLKAKNDDGSQKYDNDDLISQLSALKGAAGNPETLKKAIIGLAQEANHSFHSNIQGPERFDPTISTKDAEGISKNENKLQDIGELWNKQFDFDAGVGSGKPNSEAQGGTTTPGTEAKKPTVGDILMKKLDILGFHLNVDTHSGKSGLKLPTFLINELKNAKTEAEATKLMEKIVGYLKGSGAVTPKGNGETQTGN